MEQIAEANAVIASRPAMNHTYEIPQKTSYWLAFLYSVLVTVLVGWFSDPSRLHEWMLLSDQAMYITSARNYLDKGVIESTIVSPLGFSNEGKRHFFYMPGYTVLLAAVYAIFGYGLIQSLLPTAILYVVSCMLCFRIGAKLYSIFAAWITLILYSSFPFMHLLSVDALSDVTIITAFLLSFAIFIELSPRCQLLCGWLLPALAFIFRETSALIIFPMCAVLLNGPKSSVRWRNALYFFVASLMAISIVYFMPFSTTRNSPFYDLIVYENDPELVNSQLYGSSLSPQRIVFVQKMLQRALRQSLEFATSLKIDLRCMEWLYIISVIPIGIVYYVLRRDCVMLSVAVSVIIMMVALLSLYLMGHIGKKNILHLVPFVSLVYAQVVATVVPMKWHKIAVVVVLLAVVPLSMKFVYNDWRYHRSCDRINDEMLMEYEQMEHDNSTVLMASAYGSPSYAIVHYPVKILPIVYSKNILKKLMNTYNITTIVLPINSDRKDVYNGTKITREDLVALGFRCIRSFSVDSRKYEAYRK